MLSSNLHKAISKSRVAVQANSAIVRYFAVSPEKMLKSDQPTYTSWNAIADRTADLFFMTEIFRALWLTFEVAMKPKVTINYPFEKGPISPRFRGMF